MKELVAPSSPLAFVVSRNKEPLLPTRGPRRGSRRLRSRKALILCRMLFWPILRLMLTSSYVNGMHFFPAIFNERMVVAPRPTRPSFTS